MQFIEIAGLEGWRVSQCNYEYNSDQLCHVMSVLVLISGRAQLKAKLCVNTKYLSQL